MSMIINPFAHGVATDPFWADVSLLIQPRASDATYVTDATGKTITYGGGAALSSSALFPGGKSIAFDGAGDFITLADSAAWDFEDEDFVVEAWVRATTTSNKAVVGQWDVVTDKSWYLYVNGSNNLACGYSTDGLATTGTSTAGAVSTATDTYLAVVRSGTSLTTYVQGAGGSAHSIGTATLYNSGIPLTAGSVDAGVLFNWDGLIYSIRVTKDTDRGMTGASIPVPTTFWPTS